MNIYEVLKITIDLLESIQVPVKYRETIAQSIANAAGNLRVCVEAMEENMKKAEEAKGDASGEAEPGGEEA